MTESVLESRVMSKGDKIALHNPAAVAKSYTVMFDDGSAVTFDLGANQSFVITVGTMLVSVKMSEME